MEHPLLSHSRYHKEFCLFTRLPDKTAVDDLFADDQQFALAASDGEGINNVGAYVCLHICSSHANAFDNNITSC